MLIINHKLLECLGFVSKSEVDIFLDCVSDLLVSEDVQKMCCFTQHGDTTTFDHCLMVSFSSFRFCRKFNLDYRAAARGGLLHDLFLYDWHDKKLRSNLHGFHHPSIALRNADSVFDLDDKEREIIKRHMWPLTVVPPKCREAYVICYFDKSCTVKEVFKEWGVSLRKLITKMYVKK